MTTPERRAHTRHRKRIQVRYRTRDESTWHTAYSKDISGCGVFIYTNQPLERGHRMTLELVDDDESHKLEGIVARRVIVAQHLRKLGSSGMAIRFLRPDELVAELVLGDTVADAARDRAAGSQPEPTVATASDTTSGRIFPVYFRSDREFLQSFVRNIACGGLFVPTQQPAEMNQGVTVEICPPGSAGRGVMAQGRVVSVPGSGIDSDEPGMGVAFLDPERVVRELQPHIDRLGVSVSREKG